MSHVADSLRDRARTYDLSARALADQPDMEAQLSALTFAAVAITLHELAETLDHEQEEAA